MFSQYGELRPTTAWDRSGSLRHPSKFQQVSRLGSITAAMSLNGCQPNFAWRLAVSCAGTLRIHFRGFLPRYGILLGAKFTLHPPSLAFSYFGSVTARHSSSGREPNFAALSTGRHLYSAGRPSRWALSHILVKCVLLYFQIVGYETVYAIMRILLVKFHCNWTCRYINYIRYWRSNNGLFFFGHSLLSQRLGLLDWHWFSSTSGPGRATDCTCVCVCVCVCGWVSVCLSVYHSEFVRTITVELGYLRPRYLAWWFILILSRSNL